MSDDRRKNRYEKQQTHFSKSHHQPRTMKDQLSKTHSTAETYSVRRSTAENIALAQETIKISEDKSYPDPVKFYFDQTNFQKMFNKMHSITYPPDHVWPAPTTDLKKYDTFFEVEVESSLAGCWRKTLESPNNVIGCLNFASAKNPGGGFQRGTMAQEESLAYSSALYQALKDSPMYEFNRRDLHDGLYTDYMIASDNVPVFRHDAGDLIALPYPVTFLTSPAVNVGVARSHNITQDTIYNTMRQRMDKVLAMALEHKIDTLILGSWGCGVFQGDIQVVAHLFIELLTTKYDGVFQEVVFSTLDPKHKQVFEMELDKVFKNEFYGKNYLK